MDVESIVSNATESQAKDALLHFLGQYMSPVFGALPKNEVELVVLTTLEKLGAIQDEPELYELVSKLKVTRSKARRLIYDRELRRASTKELDDKVRHLLARPIIQKSGDLFVLEIENPLVSDHLRSRVQKLGYVSDGSFSPSIVKLGLDAIVALIESFLSEKEKKEVTKILRAAGANESTFRGVLRAALRKIASKVADEAGEALIDKAYDYMSPFVEAATDKISTVAADLFSQNQK